MTLPEVAELLSLTGHELRAPTGVLGGYLSLIEKRAATLSPDHQRALAGARRAQQRLVQLLDELRSISALWNAEAARRPAVRTPIATVATLLASGATDVVVEWSHDAGSLPGEVALTSEELRIVLDALAQAVVREHGGVLRCRLTRDTFWCQLDVVSTTPADDVLPRPPFSRYRGGLGLTLVRAFALVERASGRIEVIEVDGVARGVRATLPLVADD
jgi:signal transduction histidine kinase